MDLNGNDVEIGWRDDENTYDSRAKLNWVRVVGFHLLKLRYVDDDRCHCRWSRVQCSLCSLHFHATIISIDWLCFSPHFVLCSLLLPSMCDNWLRKTNVGRRHFLIYSSNPIDSNFVIFNLFHFEREWINESIIMQHCVYRHCHRHRH